MQKAHFRDLAGLIPGLGDMKDGESIVLSAPANQELTFHVLYRKGDEAVVALKRYFNHPSGDCFSDGGMEMKIDFRTKEATPFGLEEPLYWEEGCVLPPLGAKSLDDALHEWLATLQKHGFKAAGARGVER